MTLLETKRAEAQAAYREGMLAVVASIAAGEDPPPGVMEAVWDAEATLEAIALIEMAREDDNDAYPE